MPSSTAASFELTSRLLPTRLLPRHSKFQGEVVGHRPEAFNQPGGFIYRSMRVFALRSILACLRERFLFRPRLRTRDRPELRYREIDFPGHSERLCAPIDVGHFESFHDILYKEYHSAYK